MDLRITFISTLLVDLQITLISTLMVELQITLISTLLVDLRVILHEIWSTVGSEEMVLCPIGS